jgi:ketosteroid isomerase-like protein
MVESNQEVVRRYIAACSSGDREALLDVLATEAIHYFSPREMKPVRGADRIAQFWLDAQVVSPHWTIDNIVSQDDQVVIEYTNVFLREPGDPSTRTLNRGSEWYRLSKGKITEIRAYFESDYSRDGGLTDYPYEPMVYTSKGAGT